MNSPPNQQHVSSESPAGRPAVAVRAGGHARQGPATEGERGGNVNANNARGRRRWSTDGEGFTRRVRVPRHELERPKKHVIGTGQRGKLRVVKTIIVWSVMAKWLQIMMNI